MATVKQAANQGQNLPRQSSQKQNKTGPETILKLQHKPERSNQQIRPESGCLQHRSKVPPRSTAISRAGDRCTYNSAQQRAEGPGLNYKIGLLDP